MKINPNSWKSNNDDDKKPKRADWIADARRRGVAIQNEENAATKHKQLESPLKDETRFVGVLESAVNPAKPQRTGDETGEERREDEKKDRKSDAAAREKDSSENASGGERIERNGSSYGGQFGGGSGNFSGGGDISQTLHLSENFAARSILHIADLERMISAIRAQAKPGGKREIYLELKRSALEGLRVKISTDAARQVRIEFLARSEAIRSQIENHAEDLRDILRGRGISLQSLRAVIDSDSTENSFDFAKNIEKISDKQDSEEQAEAVAAPEENTFANDSTD